MKTALFIIYIIGVVFFLVYGMIHPADEDLDLNKWEELIITSIIALLWMPIGVILCIGGPIYWLYSLIHPEKKSDDSDSDDHGFDYESHQDWCDGTSEYED